MKSCKEKAAEWGISSRAVNDMCKKGKVAGAVKENGTWRIPDDAAKPADKRDIRLCACTVRILLCR